MIWKLLKEVDRYERLVRLAMPMREYIEKGEGVAISGDRNNIKITLSGDGADLEDVSWLMMGKNPKHDGIWELKNIRSTKSYGHFLVDIALEIINKFGDKGLMIDRDKISDDGKRFWKSFEGGKLGTDWILLPEELSQYKGDEKYLDYYISGGNKGRLEKLISDGELYSEDFDFGQGKMI